MIADIVLLLWLVMAAILGWKRKALLEFNSLLILLISYGLARLVAMNMAPSLTPSMHFGKTILGPVGTEVVVSFGLCILLYVLLTFIWKKVRPVEDQAGIRIELDAQGEPKVSGAKLKAFVGMLFGITRSAIMYLAVLQWLTLLVPIISYKDGRGLTVVHPDSYSVKALRQVDPLMQQIDWSARGLRSLQYIYTNAKVRREAQRNPATAKLLQHTEIRALRKHPKMLKRANSQKQGRRDSTLLLWMGDFQQAVTTPRTHDALKRLASTFPAPFDRAKARAKSKTRSLQMKPPKRRK